MEFNHSSYLSSSESAGPNGAFLLPLDQPSLDLWLVVPSTLFTPLAVLLPSVVHSLLAGYYFSEPCQRGPNTRSQADKYSTQDARVQESCKSPFVRFCKTRYPVNPEDP